MRKWTIVSIRVTQEEKEQLREFTKDYAKTHNIKGDYTLNKHLRDSMLSLMKCYYKEYPKENVKELKEQLVIIQKQLDLINERINKI